MEKPTLSVSELKAFGVVCSTRYSSAYEMMAMLGFVNELRYSTDGQFVLEGISELFYDSKAAILSITCNPSWRVSDRQKPENKAVRAVWNTAIKYFSTWMLIHDQEIVYSEFETTHVEMWQTELSEMDRKIDADDPNGSVAWVKANTDVFYGSFKTDDVAFLAAQSITTVAKTWHGCSGAKSQAGAFVNRVRNRMMDMDSKDQADPTDLSYDAYMNSEAWKRKRIAVLRRCNGVCEGCGEQLAKDIHHLTYPDRFGTEMLWTLKAVCTECHNQCHPERAQSHVDTDRHQAG